MMHELKGQSRLVVNFGIPIFAHAQCVFDKERGTLKIQRRSLLQVSQAEFPLSAVLDFYVRRGRKSLATRYTAILKIRRHDRLELRSLTRRQAKKAIRTVRQFLYN
jgi:hypothetical protein